MSPAIPGSQTRRGSMLLMVGPHQDVWDNSLEACVIITHHSYSAQQRHCPGLHRKEMVRRGPPAICRDANLHAMMSCRLSRRRIPTLPSCNLVPRTSVHRSTAISVMPLSCRLPVWLAMLSMFSSSSCNPHQPSFLLCWCCHLLAAARDLQSILANRGKSPRAGKDHLFLKQSVVVVSFTV